MKLIIYPWFIYNLNKSMITNFLSFVVQMFVFMISVVAVDLFYCYLLGLGYLLKYLNAL